MFNKHGVAKSQFAMNSGVGQRGENGKQRQTEESLSHAFEM